MRHVTFCEDVLFFTCGILGVDLARLLIVAV
jgi:hypothetical protein